MPSSAPSGPQPDRLSLDSIGTGLRPILAMMAGSSVVLSVVALLVFTETGTVPAAVTAIVVGLALGFAAWTVPAVRLSPLDPAQSPDPEAAASTLRNTGILVMVVAQLPATAGIVISFVVGGWLPAVLGGVLGTAAVLALGPTRARLIAWRDRLEFNGGETGL